jgi:hypothetical protein
MTIRAIWVGFGADAVPEARVGAPIFGVTAQVSPG